MKAQDTFVLFPLGARRFALPAERVTELARSDRLHAFPHTTPRLQGVLVRRGWILPVCDVAEVLIGPEVPPRKFYLIANCKFDGASEPTAIPVTGECELATVEVRPRAGKLPDYVTGLLSMPGSEIIELLDLDTLVATALAEPAPGKLAGV